ncbi:MAG: preprotein translocase subunit YajC [Firmicutes bacterium]|uniref:Preprotein translocase subunit YajC n=1 Tax=Melghirimyces thermohalophilus TaxID=1236220 RepID=A0A1G6JJ10_9BACL|nr:preprotein translocase subunit YajC [Melghirimyces thermohalophilus]MDA8351937.1 preprotein translocase subunit YajC [Bacillota bacterium]SDC18703.1 preprotein translocase subunit YajC [Melghirimyces thermohalophilus]
MEAALAQFLPLIIILAVFYFLLIRPQQKRNKERNAMLAGLKKGDKVVTIGGLHGTIMDLTDDRVTLKVNDQSRLVFERSAVNAVVNQDGDKEEQKENNS